MHAALPTTVGVAQLVPEKFPHLCPLVSVEDGYAVNVYAPRPTNSIPGPLF